MPQQRLLVRADLGAVGAMSVAITCSAGDEATVGAVSHGDLKVQVLALRLAPDELAVDPLVHPLGLFNGVADEIVAGRRSPPSSATSWVIFASARP